MFNTSTLVIIVIAIAAFVLIYLLLCALKLLLYKKSASTHFLPRASHAGLTYHLGENSEDFGNVKSVSLFREIPRRVWEDFCHFVLCLFCFRTKQELEDLADKYDPAEEKETLQNILRDECRHSETDSLNADINVKPKTATAGIIQTEMVQEEKAEDEESNFGNSMTKEEEEKLNELRASFMEARRIASKSLERKLAQSDTELTAEDAVFARSFLSDLLNECESLSKAKIKSRIEFLLKNLQK